MVLQSPVPTDISPALRVREFNELVREISTTRSAAEMLAAYRARSQFVVPWDRIVSLSRRYSVGDEVRVTRSSAWTSPIDPWKERERLPVLNGGLLHRLIHAGKPIKIDRLEFPDDDPSAEFLTGMNSALAAPIYHRGEPLYMVLLLREAPEAYTLDDLATLVLTSNLVGQSNNNLINAVELDRAYKALDREFRLVGEIQRELLPRELPSHPGISVAAHYETSTQAGGDYYDFFKLPGGKLGVIVADVSGHGSPAAVVMAMIHALMNAIGRACAGGEADDPAFVLEYLNANLFTSMRSGQFATAFYGVLDPATREFRFASAGHNPPRHLRRADNDVIPLDTPPALPLAVAARLDAETTTVRFEPGDRLLLYTDGITETFDAAREQFGTDRLDATLHCCSRTPAGLIEAVRKAVNNFSGGAAADDRTLVAIAFD